MDIVNWTPSNIWDARGKTVKPRNSASPDRNPPMRVNLYSDGWTIGSYHSLDIWTACRVLNDHLAVIVPETPEAQ